MRKVSSIASLTSSSSNGLGGGGGFGLERGRKGGAGGGEGNSSIERANYKTLLKRSPSRLSITETLKEEYPNDMNTIMLTTQSLQTTRTSSTMNVCDDFEVRCSMDDSALVATATAGGMLEQQQQQQQQQQRPVKNGNSRRSSLVSRAGGPFRRSVNSCENLDDASRRRSSGGDVSASGGSSNTRRTSSLRRSSLLSLSNYNSDNNGTTSDDNNSIHKQRYDKLEGYIKNQKWNKLLKVLDPNESSTSSMAEFFLYVSHMERPLNNPSLLHLACQNHPPIDVVECLYRLDPSWLFCQNNIEYHTPLHVAAKYGAHPFIIQFLLEQEEQYYMQHQSSTTRFEEDNEDAAAASTTTTSTTCLALVRDVNGKTPLELHMEYTSNVDNTCDPSSFTQEEHDEHRERRMLNNDDADDSMMFTEFLTVVAYRTYGPINDVIYLLKNAEKQGRSSTNSTNGTISYGTTPVLTTDRNHNTLNGSHNNDLLLRALPSTNKKTNNNNSTNVFASFLAETNPTDMSELFDPVAPGSSSSPSNGTMMSLKEPSLSLPGFTTTNTSRKEKNKKDKKSSGNLFSSSSSALFSLSSKSKGSKLSLKTSKTSLQSSMSSTGDLTRNSSFTPNKYGNGGSSSSSNSNHCLLRAR